MWTPPWQRPRRRVSPFDRLHRPHVHALTFLFRHLAIGLAAAWTLGGLLLATDFGGMRTMIFRSGDWFIWLFLLFFGLSITFGGVAMAWGVMSLGTERDL